MTPIILRPEARRDALEAFEWYERRRPGLGTELREALDAVFAQIVETPLAFAVLHRDVRRAPLRRFPYAVFYRVVEDTIVVIAIVHGRMHARAWQKRR